MLGTNKLENLKEVSIMKQILKTLFNLLLKAMEVYLLNTEYIDKSIDFFSTLMDFIPFFISLIQMIIK